MGCYVSEPRFPHGLLATMTAVVGRLAAEDEACRFCSGARL